MAGKETGSEGRTRNTTSGWASDPNTYPQGHELINVDTGERRISKGAAGNTWATAWTYSTGGATGFGDLTGTPQDNTALAQQLETLSNAIGAINDAKATTRRNGVDVIGLVTDRYEGTTDVDGHLQFDLSAYTSIKLTGGGGNDRALIATPDDSTPATYRIAFTEDTGDPANTRSAWFTIEAILV